MLITLTRFICDKCKYQEDHAGVGPGIIREVLNDGWSSKDGRDLCFTCAAAEHRIVASTTA